MLTRRRNSSLSVLDGISSALYTQGPLYLPPFSPFTMSIHINRLSAVLVILQYRPIFLDLLPRIFFRTDYFSTVPF